MFLITDELVRAVRTAVPCRRKALASQAENVLSSYCLCRIAIRAVLRVFVCVACLGRSGRLVRVPGIVTGQHHHDPVVWFSHCDMLAIDGPVQPKGL
jgi:hypothetical protein